MQLLRVLWPKEHWGARVRKISIVTPSYNQAQFLEECLESVQLQSCSGVEHIVMDGASGDGTVEILKRYSGEGSYAHLQWRSEPDQGQSDALNKGFRLATGEIVGWLNSDDRYRPGCFRTVVDAFEKNPDVDILYGDYTWIDESGHVFKIRQEIEFSQFVLSYHRVLYIPTTATFFRRRIFDEGNFIDLKYDYSMDYEFFLRLAGKGYRFKHVPGLFADFRWQSNSKSCAHPERQFAEHDVITATYSRVLRNLGNDTSRKLTLSALRLAAAGLRYSEKLVRGYYLGQIPFVARKLEMASRMRNSGETRGLGAHAAD
jgi:glycosyltransferase involved in cell wall biosynthesis